MNLRSQFTTATSSAATGALARRSAKAWSSSPAPPTTSAASAGGRTLCMPCEGRLRTGAAGGGAPRMPGDSASSLSVRAAGEQFDVGLERGRDRGQVAVHRIELPRGHVGQHGVGERDAAVAAVGRVQVFQSFLAGDDARRRERGVADHQRHLRGVGRQRGHLRVEPAAQRHGAVQHRLRRGAPLVDRALGVGVVPVHQRLQRGHVVVGQFLPGRRAVQAQHRIEQRGLQLDEAGHAGHDLARARVVEDRAERGQRIAEGVVARQHLHRRPRAAVGRAEHHQPRAVARHQPLPRRGRLQLHRARDQPAHRVREQPHRLAAGVARRRARHPPPCARRRASSSIGRRQS